MEILILGAGGMAGHVIATFLREQGHTVYGFSRTSLSYCNSLLGDALTQDDIKRTIMHRPFDAIINCIGVLNRAVDAQLADSIYINSYLPHLIVEELKSRKTKFIHLSTDCVFSGRAGGYREDSFKDSDSFYGMTKSLGEVNDSKNLTIRTSIVGPDRNKDGIGLMNWFLSQNRDTEGFTSAIWTGVSTVTLAHSIKHALEQNLTGLYHLVNNQTISKYKLLQLFNRYLKKEPIILNENNSLSVNKSLVNQREDFNFKVPSYEQMVKDTKTWIDAHKEFYPHYF